MAIDPPVSAVNDLPLISGYGEERISWRRNLLFVWISQFLSIAAFSFAIPFAPLYIKTLDVSDTQEAAYWAGWFASSAAISLMIMSPIWGGLGDRFGRKIMLVRANLLGAVLLYAMGCVHSVFWLIALRFGQGMFTGTVPAAMTLVSVNTPERRHGMAIGLLTAAIHAGGMAGFISGGLCAEAFGPARSFQIAGFLLAAAGLVAMLGVRENFEVSENKDASAMANGSAPGHACAVAAVLGLLVLANLGRTVDTPVFALFIETLLAPGTTGAFAMTGWVSAAAAVAAVLGAVISGRLLDRFSSSGLGAICALVASLGLMLSALSSSLPSLFAARSIFALASTGFEPAMQIWLTRLTASAQRGKAFGWATTARSLGWILGPLLGAYIARKFCHLAAAFWLAAIVMFLLAILAHAARRFEQSIKPENRRSSHRCIAKYSSR